MNLFFSHISCCLGSGIFYYYYWSINYDHKKMSVKYYDDSTCKYPMTRIFWIQQHSSQQFLPLLYSYKGQIYIYTCACTQKAIASCPSCLMIRLSSGWGGGFAVLERICGWGRPHLRTVWHPQQQKAKASQYSWFLWCILKRTAGVPGDSQESGMSDLCQPGVPWVQAPRICTQPLFLSGVKTPQNLVWFSVLR